MKQSPGQGVDEYVQVFTGLWDRWCRTLRQEVPPQVIKKNLFTNGLLPQMKIKVELKSPKTYDDTVKIAKEKEAKTLKMKELGLCSDTDIVSTNDVSVNMVEVSRNLIQSAMNEPQRPKQVQRGMFYMPLGFLPKSSKQVKVAEQQVDVKPAEKSSENVCLGQDMNEVQILPVDLDVERKDMPVGNKELLVDSPLAMDVKIIKNSDIESLVEGSSSVESDDVPVHGSVDLDDALEFADDEHEDESDIEIPEEDFSREEDGVEIANVFENVCDVNAQNKEDDLVIRDFLEQINENAVSEMEKVDILSWDASCEEESLDSNDTKVVGNTEKEVYAGLVDEDQGDANDVLEDDSWDIASLDEQEPEIEMDADMLVSVSKASMHVAKILKAKVMIKKDAEETELKDDVTMPVLDNVEVSLDAPVVKNDDEIVCESAKVETWASQMLLDWMLIFAMPHVLKTKMYVVGEMLYQGLCQEHEPIDDDAWRETMTAYEDLDQDDFGEHVLNVWYVLMPLSWKNAMKENNGTNQFPFDPGGWIIT